MASALALRRGCLMASFLSVAEAVVPWLKGFLADRDRGTRLLAPPISSPSYQIIHITQKRDFFFSDHTKIMSKTLEKAQFSTSKVWPFLRQTWFAEAKIFVLLLLSISRVFFSRIICRFVIRVINIEFIAAKLKVHLKGSSKYFLFCLLKHISFLFFWHVTFLKENVCFGKKSNAYQRGEELKGNEEEGKPCFSGNSAYH